MWVSRENCFSYLPTVNALLDSSGSLQLHNWGATGSNSRITNVLLFCIDFRLLLVLKTFFSSFCPNFTLISFKLFFWLFQGIKANILLLQPKLLNIVRRYGYSPPLIFFWWVQFIAFISQYYQVATKWKWYYPQLSSGKNWSHRQTTIMNNIRRPGCYLDTGKYFNGLKQDQILKIYSQAVQSVG